MSFKKLIWNNLHTRIWFLMTAITLAVVLAVSIVATQVPLIRGTLNILWGKERPILGDSSAAFYECDYADNRAAFKAADELNVKIAEEGFTLLKNEGNTLPLASGTKISVFGKNSVSLIYGGTGSGGKSGGKEKTIYDSLKDAGFSYNEELKKFYENNSQSGTGRPSNPAIGSIIAGFKTGETPVGSYSQALQGTYGQYKDAALVVFGRIGGEGFDLPRTMATAYTSTGTSGKIEEARSAEDHYLQLDQNEANLLKHVCDNFSKVVVVLNSNHTLELAFLDDPAYWTDVLGLPDQSSKIQAALWIGSVGNEGIMALGKILSGTVNPSGRTVDTYARDFTKDPTYNNFGNNNKNQGNAYLRDDGENISLANRNYYIDYEEGIYVGYRYYETRAFTDVGAWWKNNVVYPFGHGLSYSEFEWEISGAKLMKKLDNGTLEEIGNLPNILSATDSDKYISVDVTVKNKAGSKPGKDVVQLYVEAPYTIGGIEKAHVVLADFGKTNILAANASQKITLTFSLYDIASYDYSDANGNGFKGYETESGAYKIHISRNAHSWADGNAAMTRTFNVSETQTGAEVKKGYQYRKDPVTGNDVVNRFDDISGKMISNDRKGEITYLSRNGWGPWPTMPADAERTVSAAFLSSLRYAKDDAGKPWYTDKMPTQGKVFVPEYNEEGEQINEQVTLKTLAGKDYGDPLWEELLNQLTVAEMAALVGEGAFGTTTISKIGKPLTYDSDGPSGFVNFMSQTKQPNNTCFYVSECVMGATFNKELIRELGKMIGNEGLLGPFGDLPFSGWYAPAINIHRSQFSGRNWEYYSEDPVLSGKMAAQVILGAKEKGVYAFVKHFAVNDSETDRDSNGLLVWANEQSIREIYFKPFETAVKDGKTTAMMSSFDRIGTVWAGGDYRLLTEVLRNEWGFKGMVITDYAVNTYLNVEQMIRAGGDLRLFQSGRPNTTNPDATQVTAIRNAAKNILFTVANSNAMNAEVLGYRLPIWIVGIIIADVCLFVGLMAWGFFAIWGSVRKERKSKNIK